MTAVWIVLAVIGLWAAWCSSSYEGEDFDPWPLSVPLEDQPVIPAKNEATR